MAQAARLPAAFAALARAQLAPQIAQAQARAEAQARAAAQAQAFTRRVIADTSLAPLSPGEMPPPARARPMATETAMAASRARDEWYERYLLANDGFGPDWPPDPWERTVDDANNPWI